MSSNIPGIRDSRERRCLSLALLYLKAEPRAGVAKPKPRTRGAARMLVLSAVGDIFILLSPHVLRRWDE